MIQMEFLQAITFSISLDLISFVAEPKVLHMAHLQREGTVHIPQYVFLCR